MRLTLLFPLCGLAIAPVSTLAGDVPLADQIENAGVCGPLTTILAAAPEGFAAVSTQQDWDRGGSMMFRPGSVPLLPGQSAVVMQLLDDSSVWAYPAGTVVYRVSFAASAPAAERKGRFKPSKVSADDMAAWETLMTQVAACLPAGWGPLPDEHIATDKVPLRRGFQQLGSGLLVEVLVVSGIDAHNLHLLVARPPQAGAPPAPQAAAPSADPFCDGLQAIIGGLGTDFAPWRQERLETGLDPLPAYRSSFILPQASAAVLKDWNGNWSVQQEVYQGPDPDQAKMAFERMRSSVAACGWSGWEREDQAEPSLWTLEQARWQQPRVAGQRFKRVDLRLTEHGDPAVPAMGIPSSLEYRVFLEAVALIAD